MNETQPIESIPGLFEPPARPDMPAPRKPFEELTREEMILDYTHLRASVAEYVHGLHETERQLAMADEFILRYPPDQTYFIPANHACEECRPESPLVIKGFKCQYHSALQRQADNAKKESAA